MLRRRPEATFDERSANPAAGDSPGADKARHRSGRLLTTAPAALGTALIASLALTACGGGEVAGSSDAGPPQTGGTLRYALSQAPTCSDPAQAGSNQTIYVTRTIVDSLTDQNVETGEIVPWLAESWDVNPEATSYTFRLRDGVTFSDGTAFDATAVKANFDAIQTLGAAKAPLGAGYLTGYTGTTVVDPLTARVDFSAPNSQFLQATATSQLGIQSPETNTQSPEDRCLGDNIGTGPFVYSDNQQDRSASAVRRDGYDWASSATAHQGEAYLDGIDFTVVPEAGVRAGSLASDQIDAASDALTENAPQIEGAGGRIVVTSNPGTPFGLVLNVTRGPLADPAVRTALIPAINRQELVDTVLGPDFKPATSSLASATPGYVAQPSVTFDPDAATAALDAAGWVLGPDGIRVKDGQNLSFGVTFSAVFAGNQAILELTQQQLRQVGVDLQLDVVSSADFTARQNAGDYDSYYGNATRADGDILRIQFSALGRNLNRQPQPDPELEAAFVDELSTANQDERNEIFARIQARVLELGLIVPTIELSQSIGAGPNAQAIGFDASARLQFYDTWLSAS